jgi:hypothetical protein
MLKGDKVKLVGVSETLPDLIHRATHEHVIPQTQNVTRPGVPESLIFADWKKMIDETKPDSVWAFTPTNGHVEVVRYGAPKGIHVIMEKRRPGAPAAGSEGPGAPQGEALLVKPLRPERYEPIAYMVDRIHNKLPLDGRSALTFKRPCRKCSRQRRCPSRPDGRFPCP